MDRTAGRERGGWSFSRITGASKTARTAGGNFGLYLLRGEDRRACQRRLMLARRSGPSGRTAAAPSQLRKLLSFPCLPYLESSVNRLVLTKRLLSHCRVTTSVGETYSGRHRAGSGPCGPPACWCCRRNHFCRLAGFKSACPSPAPESIADGRREKANTWASLSGRKGPPQ